MDPKSVLARPPFTQEELLRRQVRQKLENATSSPITIYLFSVMEGVTDLTNDQAHDIVNDEVGKHYWVREWSPGGVLEYVTLTPSVLAPSY